MANREGGKDTSVQRGRHKDGSQRESGTCEGGRTLPLHRYRVKGPRAMMREARIAAARAVDRRRRGREGKGGMAEGMDAGGRKGNRCNRQDKEVGKGERRGVRRAEENNGS